MLRQAERKKNTVMAALHLGNLKIQQSPEASRSRANKHWVGFAESLLQARLVSTPVPSPVNDGSTPALVPVLLRDALVFARGLVNLNYLLRSSPARFGAL